MAKVNTLSSDVQRSNSDIFSVKPMESHGKMINMLSKFLQNIYHLHILIVDSFSFHRKRL